MIKRSILSLLIPFALIALSGCGGGGSGAPPATVTGTVYIISTTGGGIAPNPPAMVSISGQSQQTDINGNFTFLSVPSNSTSITVSTSGATTLTQALPVLTPNATNNLQSIYLTTTGTGYTATATGTVVDVNTLKPISGATVILNGLFATTNASGQFTISGLPVGLGGTNSPVGLVTATGYDNLPLVLSLPLGDSTPPNQVNDLGNIALAPPVSGTPPTVPSDINGKVTLQGMATFAGVTVSLLNSSGTVISQTTTASDGSYGFWVATGAYTLQFNYSSYQPQSQPVTLTHTDQPVTVNVTLVQ